MTTLLQINSSIFSSGGHSSQLANDFVSTWHTLNPDVQVKVRDLATEPLPHLDAQRVSAFFASPDARTPEQQSFVNESDTLINEIKQSNVIVIGLPMYNFGIPSTLKAYFDQIARAGLTFRYTENGPEGLLSDKKVFVFATRGGMYAGTPLDSQTTYVRDFLNFLGITDVEFIYAEGLNMSQETKDKALAKAHQRLAELAA
ncbi:NAD(P)H-dependent oxidoreductase [Methylicorpusculum oleiharenae]|uniref:FMN-dependent NADH-azoreductase n=1 Tax=Methylicorpusculum oleiharenae TaxID=1338687 RepID=UPI0013585EBA|nr:NAD(P)H-dependent oxidoreductase [Methylicorpusculum oleiharenae]MCD2451602.1 NAD(P)H-dependent oxidoreductase [Methylicorpusculum oleiharenae]